MATLLDAPKANAAKYEEFVAKQIADVRRRIRIVDIYSVSVAILGAFFIFLFALLLVDRYLPTRPGVGWAALAGFAALAAAYAYRQLFRAARQQINPYYAAKQVEETVPDAKNSLVNWIDLHEDHQLPASLKMALGARAAKDLRQADLTQVGGEKSFVAGLLVAGFFLVASGIVYFLPPTRTEIRLELPKDGNATVFSGEDVRFEARIVGRIPKPADADSTRLRIWYNSDDDETYEDRALDASPDDRRLWGVTVAANQVRKGFDYQIRSGGVATERFHLTCKIIPILTGFEVTYRLPAYLKKADEKSNDPNLFNYYGTQVTLRAATNRSVKSGYLQIEGLARTYDAEVSGDDASSLLFRFPIEKEGSYRIFFTTVEGDRNSDPQKYRIALVDPKPAFTRFDIQYRYPEYLRWKPQTVTDQKSADLEAIKGTEATVTARGNRPAKAGSMTIDGIKEPVAAQLVKDDPMAVRFALPAFGEDGKYQLRFTPATGEAESEAKTFAIRVNRDEIPQVRITKPVEKLIELPLNDTLKVEGVATDDHGLSRMNLRMVVVEPRNENLAPKPYREGKEFKREKDNSFPIRLDYKDQVALADLRSESDANFRIEPGMLVEYWLEAIDNCNVPPGPNHGYSASQRVRVIAAVKAPDKVEQQKQQQQKFDRDRKEMEQKQDKQNAEENRDPQQPPAKQDAPAKAEQPKDGKPEGKDKQAKAGEGQPQPKEGDAGDAQPKEGQEGNAGKPQAGTKGVAQKESKTDPAGKSEDKNPDRGMKPDAPGKDSQPTPEEQQTEQQAKKIQEALNKDRAQASNQPNSKPRENKREEAPMPKESGEQQPKPASGPGQVGKPEAKDKSQAPPPEPGELSREIASSDYKMNQGQKEDVDRLLRDEKKKQELEKKLDEMKNDIKDPAKKEQFEKDVEQAKKDAKEKEDIDELAKKQKSKDANEAKDAQDQLDKKMQKPESRKNGEQMAREKGEQGEKGNDPAAKKEEKAIQDAMAKGREQNLKDAAKKMQSDDPKQQAEGKKEMDDLQKDPAARKQAEQMKDDLAKDAGDDQKKQDFQKKMDDSAKKGRQDNIDQVAKDAESKDPRDQERAKKEQENLAKNDPQGGKEAEEKLKAAEQKRDEKMQARNQPKDQPNSGDGEKGGAPKKPQPNGKKGGDKSGGEPGAESDAEDLKREKGELDRELNSKNPKIDKSRQEQMERLMRDPKLREQLEKKSEEMQKNAPSDQARQEIKDKFDEARKNADQRNKLEEDADKLTKKPKPAEPKTGDGEKPKDPSKDGSKPEAKKGDGKNGDGKEDEPKAADAKQGEPGDPKAGGQQAEQTRKDLEKKAENPKDREQMEKAAQEMQQRNPEGAKELQKAADKGREEELKQAAKQVGEKPGEGGEGQKNLADAMKDPKTRDMLQNRMKEMADQVKDPEKRKALEEQMKKAADEARKEDLKNLADRAKKAGQDQKEMQKAAKDLQELMQKDPEARKAMEEMAKQMDDPETKKGVQELQKKAEELAQKKKEQAPMPKEAGDTAGKPKESQEPKANPKESPDKKEGEGLGKGDAKQPKDDPAKKEPGKTAGGGAPKDGTRTGENPDLVAESKGPEQKLEGMPADLRNQQKSRELQLDDFRKIKDNKEIIQQQLKMTPEEYEKFLKSYEEYVAKQRQLLAEIEKKEEAKPRGAGSSILNRTGDRVKLEGSADDSIERSRQVSPPPGFDDAFKRLNNAGDSK